MSANVEAMPERGRLTPGETIADSRAMTARQLRKILRRPTYIVYLFVQPVILVLLFRYVFGGAINTGRVSYVDFLMPGIIVMTAVFGSLTTGLGLTEDIKAGVVDRFRSLPIACSAVLLGRTAADLVMNTLALTLTLLIGVVVGFRPDQPFYEVALAFALVLAFAYVFSWISAYVGLSVRDPETAQPAGFIWVFPLVFASFAFVPTASMPAVVHTFADTTPSPRPSTPPAPSPSATSPRSGQRSRPSPGSPGCSSSSCPWRSAPSGERDGRGVSGRDPDACWAGGGFAGGPGLRASDVRRDELAVRARAARHDGSTADHR